VKGAPHTAGREPWRDECIAFALATGIAPIFSMADTDADIERASRRARWERKKAKREDRF
jgi:hypothetical protein